MIADRFKKDAVIKLTILYQKTLNNVTCTESGNDSCS